MLRDLKSNDPTVRELAEKQRIARKKQLWEMRNKYFGQALIKVGEYMELLIERVTKHGLEIGSEEYNYCFVNFVYPQSWPKKRQFRTHL
jgi:hypothetical protein